MLLENFIQVARHLVKTISQLGSGKQPVGTTAYMGRLEHLMQCRSDVRKGIMKFLEFTNSNHVNQI